VCVGPSWPGGLVSRPLVFFEAVFKLAWRDICTDMNRVGAARTTGCYRKSILGTTKHTGCSCTHTHEHRGGLWREALGSQLGTAPGRKAEPAAAAQHEKGRVGMAARSQKQHRTPPTKKKRSSIQHTGPRHLRGGDFATLPPQGRPGQF
jgi:hypothetical protein